jgi:beta-lactamase regulating signal transducer with metallopeptidase domain
MIELLNDTGRLWAGYFVPALVQNTVFLALVFLALHWFRNASASTKYAIAAVGLVKLLLPPFVPTTLLVPAAGEQVAFPASTLLFSFTNLSAGAETVPPDTPAGLNLFGALFVVWTIIALFVLVRAVRATIHLAQRVKDAKPVVGEPAIEAASPHDSRRIGVYKSPRIGMPLTIGVLPHRIYVPDAWERWTQECRTAVLRHEIAHIHRRDGLFQSLEIVVQALYFFHPMVWMLNRRLRAYREMACDDASVGRDHKSRLHYSKFLVELAETALRPPVACESASALLRRKHELLARVAYQVKEGDMLSMSKKRLAVIMAALILAMLPFSMYLGGNGAAGPAAAEAGKKQVSSSHPAVDVSLAGDAITVDGHETSLKMFTKSMQKAMKGYDQKPIVNISCDGKAPMASLFKVQQQLLDMGLVKVSYSDYEGNGLPVVLPDDELMKKMKQISDEDICHVKIASNGKLYVGKKKATSKDAAKYIQECLKKNPKLIVSLHMDAEATYADFVETLAFIKKSGAERIFINNPAG